MKKMKEATKEHNPKSIPDYIGHRQRLKSRFVADRGRSMPDYEILELLLTYAIPRRDVKPIAKELIKRYINLANIFVAPIEELIKIKGLGNNAAVLCALIHACTSKICWENMHNKDAPSMTDKRYLVEYCRSTIGRGGQEQLLVIYIDKHGKFIRDSIEQVGTIDAVMISPRDIIAKALLYNAYAIIIAHNHPSGDCTPSKADIQMTKQLKEGLKTVGIGLFDHVIISAQSAYSMKDHLPFMNMA